MWTGFPWGDNRVHKLRAAKEHMQLADLVVAWGTSMSILANYFDPWHRESRWAQPPPKGVRLAGAEEAPAEAAGGGGRGGRGGAKRPRRRAAVRPCRLVIINRGRALDEDLAELKIEADVDEVAAKLLRELGLPPPPPYDPQADPLLAAAVPPAAGEPRPPWTIAAALMEREACSAPPDG